MYLIPLRAAQLTSMVMLVSSYASSSVYFALFRAVITATLCAVYTGGDARSATHCIVDIYHLASTGFSLSTATSVKYKDVSQAELRVCTTLEPQDMVPTI